MSDSRTHTPTPRPWKHETGPRLGGQYHDVVDQNGILIAEAANFSEADADDTDARDAANVEHIVRCVNSHDGLVEALRLTDQLFSDMFLARMPETESIRCRAVRDRVRAALASEVTHG